MIEGLIGTTKIAAYFLWEYSGTDDALSHWHCAEDTACYFESTGIFTTGHITAIKSSGKYTPGYIDFVRHIAFRIHVYTNENNPLTNWFIAERLLSNGEWCTAVTKLASIYHAEKGSSELVTMIYSSKVRKFYE